MQLVSGAHRRTQRQASNSSVIGATATGPAAAAETQAAAGFAEKAYSLGRALGIWK